MFHSLVFLILLPFLIHFSFNPSRIIYSFKTQKVDHINENKPIKTLVVGKVLSIKLAKKVETKQYEEFSTGFTDQVEVVTIKVFNQNYTPRLGDAIYLVEDKLDENTNDALILSELKIHSISKTAFHGIQIRALGYLGLIQKQSLVVLAPILDGKKEKSLAASSKGDFWMYQKDYSKALRFYKQAITLDSYNLDNYIKLAKLYQKTKVNYLSIYYNLEKVWDRRKFFRSKKKELDFYKIYSSFLVEKFQNEGNFSNIKDLEKSILISNQGLKLNRNNPILNLNHITALYLMVQNNKEEQIKYEGEFKEKRKKLSQNEKLRLYHEFYEVSILFDFFLFEKAAIREKNILSQKIKSQIEQYYIFIPKNIELNPKITEINGIIDTFRLGLDSRYNL